MVIVNPDPANTDPVDPAPVGEDVLAKSGHRPRLLGLLRDKVWIGEDFDAPLPDSIAAPFRGEDR